MFSLHELEPLCKLFSILVRLLILIITSAAVSFIGALTWLEFVQTGLTFSILINFSLILFCIYHAWLFDLENSWN